MARLRSDLRIGLISDIHANLPALNLALNHLERAQVDRVVCLGDVVEKGPDGDAVVEVLQRRLITTVQGNHDINAVKHAELEGRHTALSDSSLAWLAALPPVREYLWAGRFVVLAHGSPVDPAIGIVPGDVPKVVRRDLRRRDADVLLVGHTHRPMHLRFAGMEIVNPGSVSHGRCDLGRTCAVLCLPAMRVEVCLLESGRWIELERSGD